jgi:hypothetical protein
MQGDTDTRDVADAYSLDAVVKGIAEDLVALREGKISIKDAQARALLVKQYMNGVRLVINARRSLENDARLAKRPALEGQPT